MVFLYLIKVSPEFVIVFHYLSLVLFCGGGGGLFLKGK